MTLLDWLKTHPPSSIFYTMRAKVVVAREKVVVARAKVVVARAKVVVA